MQTAYFIEVKKLRITFRLNNFQCKECVNIPKNPNTNPAVFTVWFILKERFFSQYMNITRRTLNDYVVNLQGPKSTIF